MVEGFLENHRQMRNLLVNLILRNNSCHDTRTQKRELLPNVPGKNKIKVFRKKDQNLLATSISTITSLASSKEYIFFTKEHLFSIFYTDQG